MTTIQCIRKIHFCAGHRVMNHASKCGTAHGHNYEAHIYAEADQLDALGMVIDFAVLKEKIGSWIDLHWDHNFLAYEKDVDLIKALMTISRTKDPFICPFNPTAENIAHYLLTKVCPECLQGTNVRVVKVVLYETVNCYVVAEIDA